MFGFLSQLFKKSANISQPRGKYVNHYVFKDFSGEKNGVVFEHADYELTCGFYGMFGGQSIIWNGGKIVSGDFRCENWNEGEFNGDTLVCLNFNGGKFNGKNLICEEFNDGECNSGIAEVSDWNDGVFRGRTLSVGEWHDGVFEGNVFHGKWYDGVWKGKQFKGIDLSGQGLEN